MYIMMYMHTSQAALQELAVDSRVVVGALHALYVRRLQLYLAR